MNKLFEQIYRQSLKESRFSEDDEVIYKGSRKLWRVVDVEDMGDEVQYQIEPVYGDEPYMKAEIATEDELISVEEWQARRKRR